MSTELIKQLTERRQNIWNEAKGLLDKAAQEKRDLSAEEEQSFDRLNTDLTNLRARIDQVTEAMATNKAAEEALTRALGTSEERRGGGTEDEGLEAEVRSFLSGERRAVETSAEAMGVAFKRALGTVTNPAGGATVPTTFHDQLIAHMVESSGLLQLGPTVLTTSGGEPIEIPVTTSHGSAGFVPEGQPIPEDDPAFDKRTLSAYKYGQLIKVARELVEDTAVDLLGYIGTTAGRNVGLAFGTKLVNGSGSNEPSGVVNVATAGKTGAAAAGGAFTAEDLIDLYFSVISPYRNSPSAGWLLKDSSLAAVRKLKDDAGRFLFEPAATFGAPDTLLGKPIQTDPNVAAVAAGAKSVLFGDWSTYFVRVVGGVRFERSDEFAFNTDQITFRALVRGDGLLADQTGAIKAFVGGAAA